MEVPQGHSSTQPQQIRFEFSQALLGYLMVQLVGYVERVVATTTRLPVPPLPRGGLNLNGCLQALFGNEAQSRTDQVHIHKEPSAGVKQPQSPQPGLRSQSSRKQQKANKPTPTNQASGPVERHTTKRRKSRGMPQKRTRTVPKKVTPAAVLPKRTSSSRLPNQKAVCSNRRHSAFPNVARCSPLLWSAPIAFRTFGGSLTVHK